MAAYVYSFFDEGYFPDPDQDAFYDFEPDVDDDDFWPEDDFAQREEDDAKGIWDDPWSDDEFLTMLEDAPF